MGTQIRFDGHLGAYPAATDPPYSGEDALAPPASIATVVLSGLRLPGKAILRGVDAGVRRSSSPNPSESVPGPWRQLRIFGDVADARRPPQRTTVVANHLEGGFAWCKGPSSSAGRSW